MTMGRSFLLTNVACKNFYSDEKTHSHCPNSVKYVLY